MQDEQRADQIFPDQITAQRDDQRLFEAMRRRDGLGNDLQPGQQPAGQPPKRGRDDQRQKAFSPSAASDPCRPGAFAPAGETVPARPGWKAAAARDKTHRASRPKLKHENNSIMRTKRIADERRGRPRPDPGFPPRPASPPNRSASKTPRATAAARPAPPADASGATAAARRAAACRSSVAGVRLPSGSKRTERQFSHSSRPARFRMKSIRAMKRDA